MPDPILSFKGVHTHIASHHILQGVSLDIPAGRATVLLGRNGAGKSTALRTAMGLTPASSGTILLGGSGIEKLRPYEIARLGVGFVPEDQAVLYNLTVEENFRLAILEENEQAHRRLEEIFILFRISRNSGVKKQGFSPEDRSRCWPSGGPLSTTTVCCLLMNRPKAWRRSLLNTLETP